MFNLFMFLKKKIRRPAVESIFFRKNIIFSKKKKRIAMKFKERDFYLNLIDKLYLKIRTFAYYKIFCIYEPKDNKYFFKWVEVWPYKSLNNFSEFFFRYFEFKIKHLCNNFKVKKNNFTLKLNYFFLVKISPWPIFSSFSLFSFFIFFVGYLHYHISVWYLFLGLNLIFLSFYFWLRDIIRELVFLKRFSKLVKYNLRTGFWLFIVSEIMFFVGCFWAFFHFVYDSSIYLGTFWPPIEGMLLNNLYIPGINTVFLLLSGVALNWVQYAILGGSYNNVFWGFFFLFMYSFFFIYSQYNEYILAFEQLNDSVYGSSMYLLTSFHGLHVLIGVLMLFVCFVKFFLGHFKSVDYLGLVLSGWYWHFVDIVWILVFVFIYLWGTWLPMNPIEAFFWRSVDSIKQFFLCLLY